MLISKGDHQVWEGFALSLSADLSFGPGIHYLQGANGSGKSSFITRVLLPRLRQNPDRYCLYLEQQMQLQVNAIKAYASVIKPRRMVNSESDTVDFLLDNLIRAHNSVPKTCCVVMDESLFAERVLFFLQSHLASFSLIYSAHTLRFPADQTITFQPLSPTRSKVYVQPT